MNTPEDPFERLLEEMSAFLRLFYENIKKTPTKSEADLKAQLELLKIEFKYFEEAVQKQQKNLAANSPTVSLSKKDKQILDRATKLQEEVKGIHTGLTFLHEKQQKSLQEAKEGTGKKRKTRISRQIGYKDWKRM